MASDSSFAFSFFFLLYLATLKNVEYYVIPSVQKFTFECPSVCPSVLCVHSLPVHFLIIFFKLGIRVDIGEECLWIAYG